MHRVDLGESFPTSIYLQKSASIQPRTSPSKFGGKYSILFTGVLKDNDFGRLLGSLVLDGSAYGERYVTELRKCVEGLQSGTHDRGWVVHVCIRISKL